MRGAKKFQTLINKKPKVKHHLSIIFSPFHFINMMESTHSNASLFRLKRSDRICLKGNM